MLEPPKWMIAIGWAVPIGVFAFLRLAGKWFGAQGLGGGIAVIGLMAPLLLITIAAQLGGTVTALIFLRRGATYSKADYFILSAGIVGSIAGFTLIYRATR